MDSGTDVGNAHVAERRVVELRVHGVSGTPPEELLDRPLVTRVAGDAVAGFYRPRLHAERTDSYPAGMPDPQVPGPQLEGYVWGGLTSGAPSRALWLLLLPFTLSNVAPRMRPADPDRRSRAAQARLWLLWYGCRALALTLTAVLITAFAGIGDDLIGWQCGGGSSGRCAAAWPGWLFGEVTTWTPARRLALGTAVPLLGILVLWWISKRSVTRYEGQPGPLARVIRDHPAWDWADPPDAAEVGLRSRWMWENDHPVRRLRALHVQVALATALWFLSAPMTAGWRWGDGLFVAAVGLGALVAIGCRSFVGHRAHPGWQRASFAGWGLLLAAFAATVAGLVADPGAVDARYRRDGALPRYEDTLLVLLFAELLLVLVLAVVVGWSARRAGTRPVFGEPGPRPAVRGYGTAVLALVSVFLASAFTAGLYLYAATWLHTGSLKPGFGQISRIAQSFVVPEPVLDAALAFAVCVGLLAVTLLAGIVAIWLLRRHPTPATPPLVPGSFATDYPDRPPSGRGRTILRAFWYGRVVDLAGPPLAALVLAAGVLSFAIGGCLFAEHVAGAGAAARWLRDRGPTGGFFTPASLQGTGGYLVVITLLAMVALGATAFRIGPTRRSVGILWDLASFWPRQAHPLAAPCYAERTVPDLAHRMRWYTGDGTDVVLAGHSQGSVISTAVLLQLRTADAVDPGSRVLPRVGLLTFGCVVRRLYGRFFPAYFGPRALRDVRTALSLGPADQRWRNLWRWTDYLGGPVRSGPPPRVAPPWQPGTTVPALDLHLLDPPYDRPPGDCVYPPPLRHSSFWKVPQFQQAVVEVAGLIAGRRDCRRRDGGRPTDTDRDGRPRGQPVGR
jgi:hypothetical protein